MSGGYVAEVATGRLVELTTQLNALFGRRTHFDPNEVELRQFCAQYGIGPSFSGVALEVERHGDFIRLSYTDSAEDMTAAVIVIDHTSAPTVPTIFSLLVPA